MFNRSFDSVALRAIGVAALGALGLLTGCAKPNEKSTQDETGREVSWARAALERNPQLEVVATDTEARTFTVKHRSSGAVQVVSLDKLAAAPIADLVAGAPAPADAPAAAPPIETAPPAQTAAAPPAESTAAAPGESGYTIQREGGQVRVSGPGVSIVSANTPSARTASAGSAAADSPIVCEGRFLHLDRRNIRVNGTAVIARNGCELHITNSTIEATGTALSVQDATVNIANSEVTGQPASLEATGKARLYVRGSTFRGIARRNDPAEINDQGGNTWR